MNAPQAPVQTPQAKAAHDARWQRIMDCVALKQPDRMPVALFCTFWMAKFAGITNRELMYDYEKTKQIAERIVLEFEPDAVAPLIATTALGRVFEAVDFRQLQWPGRGLDDDKPYQYLDREYMPAEEYASLLRDPTGFYLTRYLPRVFGAFAGFEQFPVLSGQAYIRAITSLRAFANPDLQKAILRVFAAAEEIDRFMTHSAEWNERIAGLGFPIMNGGNASAPYDVIADYFRGATGMMKDLYRHKDKLLETIEMMRRNLVSITIANAKASGNPIVMIPIHWAPDAFMSDKQFREFWWPSFRQMMIELIDAGIVPMPLWEADCTKRLEIIRDIPPGKCIYWFERTDMVKAFEVLGDVVALRGNLSPSLMTTGQPHEVDAAVRHLVDNVWNKGGSLILDTAFGIPDETPVENVRSLYRAARKYAS